MQALHPEGGRAPGRAERKLAGRLLDGDGAGVPDGLIELWDDAGERFWRCHTAADGGFAVSAAKPAPTALGAPHLDISVFARGLLQRAVTRVYFPDQESANETDPLLRSVDATRRSTMVARPGDDGGWRFDIRLQGIGETVFLVW